MTYKLKVEKSRVKDLPKEDMFEIEISSQEVYDIYIEKQHEFDLSDIKLVLDDLGDDDVLECYDFIKAQITDDMKDRFTEEIFIMWSKLIFNQAVSKNQEDRQS